MRQGTTPTLSITTNFDLNEAKKIQVVIRQNGYIITKENEDLYIEDGKIQVTLSQEETLKFNTGTCNIQLRILTNDDVAVASQIYQVKIFEILNKEVI